MLAGLLLVAYGSGLLPLAMVYPGGEYTVTVHELGASKEYTVAVVFREKIPLTSEEAAECEEAGTGRYVEQPLFTGTIKVYQDGRLVAEVTDTGCGYVGPDGATIDFKIGVDEGVTVKLPALHREDEVKDTVLRFELTAYFKGRLVGADSGECILHVKYAPPPENPPTPWWQSPLPSTQPAEEAQAGEPSVEAHADLEVTVDEQGVHVEDNTQQASFWDNINMFSAAGFALMITGGILMVKKR